MSSRKRGLSGDTGKEGDNRSNTTGGYTASDDHIRRSASPGPSTRPYTDNDRLRLLQSVDWRSGQGNYSSLPGARVNLVEYRKSQDVPLSPGEDATMRQFLDIDDDDEPPTSKRRRTEQKQPDQPGASSPSRDTGNAPTIDHTKLRSEHFAEIQGMITRISNISRGLKGKTLKYYQTVKRCLYHAMGYGVDYKTPGQAEWLLGTNPPNDRSEALSQAVEMMETRVGRMTKTTSDELKSFAAKIKGWMGE